MILQTIYPDIIYLNDYITINRYGDTKGYINDMYIPKIDINNSKYKPEPKQELVKLIIVPIFIRLF